MNYSRNETLYHAYLDDEVCLFDPNIGKYHNLNGVGSFIWDNLKKEMDINSIVSLLMGKYEVQEQQCYEETNNFINNALKEGILIAKSKNNN